MDAITGLLAPLDDVKYILDPCAGVGGIHELHDHGYLTCGIDIEPEFVEQSPDPANTYVGDATKPNDIPIPYAQDAWDAIVTSPAYGNRMADQYDGRDGSRRFTYRISLGRQLSENNGAGMQWGSKYRELHERIWANVTNFVRPKGYFVLNISDHVRGGKVMPVTQFHVNALTGLGWIPLKAVKVDTPRMRQGANGTARVDNEWVFLFQRLT